MPNANETGSARTRSSPKTGTSLSTRRERRKEIALAGRRRIGERELWDATARTIRPRERLTPLQFGTRHRTYTKEGRSARWRPESTPWACEILDTLSDESPYKRVIAPKGTQLGFTEIGLIWIGQGIVESQSALIIEPTDSVAKKVVRQKFRPMLHNTSILKGVFSARALASTLHFEAPHVDIMFAGSNSPVNFASVTVPRFFGDEIDRWSDELKEEGDPLDLAANRIAEYGFLGKMFLPCSPTVEGVSLVWKAWLESDQRYFFTPCPHCGFKQRWEWGNFKWDPGEPDGIVLVCQSDDCGKGSPEAAWKGCWGAGEWRATNPIPIRKDTAGFHLSTLYARMGQRSWAEIAQQYEAVKASGSAARMQVFYNTILGLPWKLSEDAPQVDELRSRLEPLERGVVPHGGLVLTAGIDYQKNRLEAFVWAHGPSQESWLVDKVEIRRLDNDGKRRPAKDIAADLDREVLLKDWPHADGGALKVEMASHDVSDGPADVFDVIDCLDRKRNVGVRGLEGWGQTMRFLPPKIMDVRRDGKIVKNGRLWGRTHTAEAKRDFYEDLRRPQADDGPSERYVHLPAWMDEEEGLLQGVVAEEIRKSTRGKPYWHKVHARNEPLDCAILARWAAWHLKTHRWKPGVWKARATLVAGEKVSAEAAPEQAPTENTAQNTAPAPPRRWIDPGKDWL